MNSRAQRVCLLIVGSFLVYCAQNTVGGMMKGGGSGLRDLGIAGSGKDFAVGTGGISDGFGDGFAGDAKAQSSGGTCCAPPMQMFTKLWEGTVNNTTSSPPIAVGAYQQVVVAADVANNALDVRFRPNATTPFLYAGASADGAFPGRFQVNGTDLQVGLGSNGPPSGVHVVVVGVQ